MVEATRRVTLRLGALLAMAIAVLIPSLAAAQGAPQGAPEVKSIRFVGVPSAGSMIIWIARDKGFFAEEGLDVRATGDLAAGLVTDNIIGGQAEMVYGGLTSMLMPYFRGAPIVSIGNTDYSSLWELIVHGDSPYKSLADLKGKTVAVIAPNTQCVLALRTMFERNGWDKDFLKFTVVPPPEQVAAFGARRVDASCMFDPYRLQMTRQFGGRAIWSIKEADVGGGVSGTLVMHRDFAAKNPNTVAAIQRAVGKAAEAANRDPEIVYAALATALKRDVAAVRDIALPKYANPPSMPQAVQEVATALHRYGFITVPPDVSKFDRSVLAAKQ